MLKRFISVFLTALILIASSGVGAFAQTGAPRASAGFIKTERRADAGDLKSLLRAQNDRSAPVVSGKSTLADYEQAKKQGRKFSTATKVLIGVGIAVAVVAVIFAVGRNDLESNILR
ncbi:MAG: hypothetical protein JSS81_06450 [Acidobacteria bacterium]|nr:hypothetical protein [Acidobacteriota bacterium]